MKQFISALIVLLISCQKPEEKSNNNLLLIGLLGAPKAGTTTTTPPPVGDTGTTPPPTGGTSTLKPISSIFQSNSTPIISGGATQAAFTVGLTSSSSNPKDYTLNLYLSADSTVDTSDTLMGTLNVNNATTVSRTLNVTIPSTLVPETEGLPKFFYYGILGEGVTASPTGTILIFPHKSQVILPPPYLIGAGTSLTAYTMDASTERFFFRDVAISTENKWTFSAFALTDSLDVNLALVSQSSSSVSIVSNVIVNDRGANTAERAAYSGSGSFSTVYLRVGKVAGTGTFKAAGMSNMYTPNHSLRPSCNGGTGNYANRCVDYLDANPTNSTTCAALQGAGSVYSMSGCTSTNRVARCFANPGFNDSRAVISFYSTAGDTTTSAGTACGSDILITP